MEYWEKVGSELIHKTPDKMEKLFDKVGKEQFKAYKAHHRLGYVFADNDELLLSFFKNKNEVNLLEIGSFVGQGSKFLLKIFEAKGFKPTLDSIDLMLPYLEEGSKVDYGSQAYHLLKNTEIERKEHKLILHAGRSRDVLPTLNKKFDFAYIDGEHTPGGVYLDLVMTLAKSKKKTVLLVDDMTWYDLKSVGSGVQQFMKNYRDYIQIIYAHGEKDKVFGFHKIEDLNEMKMDQIMFIVKKGCKKTLDDILHEVSKHKLHLNKVMNAGRRRTKKIR